jgi:hypothetical protein
MSQYRTLAPGQHAEIWVGGPMIREPELLFQTQEMLIEAPNWSLDGASLLLNGHGSLWRLDTSAPDRGLTVVEFDGLPELNNDHVLDPDGEHIYMSAMDGHIYRGHLDGGAVDRVTPEDGAWHFLHGVAPDGERLAYGHLDGPEWSPDGRWIYANSESFGTQPGHAQLVRIPNAGGRLERLVASDTVDWFPHLSPNAEYASYISFPAGTLGHPPDLDVEVRVIGTEDWNAPLQRYPLFGGQGTLNVNSWSPDSTRFAFVTYPVQ